MSRANSGVEIDYLYIEDEDKIRPVIIRVFKDGKRTRVFVKKSDIEKLKKHPLYKNASNKNRSTSSEGDDEGEEV